GEFVGDFGIVSARLWQGVGRGPISRGTLVESREFSMTPPSDRQPDFYARFASAYEAQLREFVRRVAAKAPLEPGLDIGWKTLLVANVAEHSARLGGRLFDLKSQDGGPISTAHDAAILAAAIGVACRQAGRLHEAVSKM